MASTGRPMMMRMALGLALVAALALAGCGRKGPLEAPPSAKAVTDTGTDNGAPPAGPTRPHRPFILDPLL